MPRHFQYCLYNLSRIRSLVEQSGKILRAAPLASSRYYTARARTCRKALATRSGGMSSACLGPSLLQGQHVGMSRMPAGAGRRLGALQLRERGTARKGLRHQHIWTQRPLMSRISPLRVREGYREQLGHLAMRPFDRPSVIVKRYAVPLPDSRPRVCPQRS